MISEHPSLIGQRVGNYVVERSLAQGGMGAVFVARHPALGREAAVKFLGRDLDASPGLMKRFMDEARITANLRHPNIVDIFDFGELDGRLYYVMELLKGNDLSDLLRRRQRFSPTETVAMLMQICEGLAAAHAVGVVHRDLKPANVFVIEGDPLRLKLMDFGIAKVLSSAGEQTSYGQIMGTPRYMSPEQALGQADRISPQSDLYSLGVIAYEMLAGVAPFEHESPVMLLVMHVRDNFRPLRDLAPDCPPELAKLVEICLNKEPAERPQSASELFERLQGLDLGFDDAQDSGFRAESTQLPIDLVARRSLGSDDTLPTAAQRLDIAPVLLERPRESAPNPGLASPQPSPQAPPAKPSPKPVPAPSEASPKLSHVAPNANRASPTPPSPEPLASSALEPVGTAAAHVQRTLDLVSITQSDESEAVPEGRTDTVHLTDSDRNVLNKLLMRMQRKGDFPAFVQNVGEVNKRADVEGNYSAEQLGTSILKDYALTAKLLRIVNSAYANRFGGKIYSVRHAIVILGFDRVRQLALSISLFKSQGKKEHAARISESAINSLVSSEISRELFTDAGLDDAEQAVVCSMFRNLGRHLVLVYLPEMYDEILSLMERHQLGLNKASERVLGISMHKLGVGIAERWRLPQRMIQAMAVIPERSGNLYREEDRLSALAEFSNQLCEIVSADLDSATRGQVLGALTNKHRHLLTIDTDDMANLLVTVQDSFEKRYSSLLGGATKTSRFSRNVSQIVQQTASQEPAPEGPHEPAVVGTIAQPLAPLPTPALGIEQEVRGAKPKRSVAKLQLAKPAIESPPASPTAPTDSQDQPGLSEKLRQLQNAPHETDQAQPSLLELLGAIAKHLQLPRVLLLRASASFRELSILCGVGEDVDGLEKELILPLAPARSAVDPFSMTFHTNRHTIIEDTFGSKVASVMPPRYYETLGSAALLLMHIPGRGNQAYILVADWDPPTQAPSQQQLAEVTAARPIVSQFAQLVAR